MDLLKLLRDEEQKTAKRLAGLQAAIRALAGAAGTNSTKPNAARGNKLRGRKLSAAHRAAIKAGIAKARKAQGKA
jgi:hypothetical protein